MGTTFLIRQFSLQIFTDKKKLFASCSIICVSAAFTISALRSGFLAFLMFLKLSKNCQSCTMKVGHQNNKFFGPRTGKKPDLLKKKLFPDPHFMGQLSQSSNSLQKHQKHQKTGP
jgi:hypothetical protein